MMNQALNKVFHPHIMSLVMVHLPLRQLAQQPLLLKMAETTLMRVFERKLKNVLSPEGILLRKLRALLIESGALISGSVFHLLSQDMDHEQFLDRCDLDIFISDDDDAKVALLLNTLQAWGPNPDSSDLQASLITHYPKNMIVRSATFGKLKVQVIITNQFSKGLETFDFDACRNYYDGQTLHFSDAYMSKTEKLGKLELFYGAWRFSLGIDKPQRLIKYIERGFVFAVDMTQFRLDWDDHGNIKLKTNSRDNPALTDDLRQTDLGVVAYNIGVIHELQEYKSRNSVSDRTEFIIDLMICGLDLVYSMSEPFNLRSNDEQEKEHAHKKTVGNVVSSQIDSLTKRLSQVKVTVEQKQFILGALEDMRKYNLLWS